MKRLRTALFLTAATVMAAAPAASQASLITQTLTFDSFADGHLFPGSTPPAEPVGFGFKFSTVGFGDRIRASDIGSPHNIVLVDNSTSNASGAGVTLSRIDGGSFSVLSFDMADLLNNSGGGGGIVGSGYRIQLSGAGSQVWSPTSSTFSTVDLSGNSAFQNLGSLGINIVSSSLDNFAVDNIVVQYEVPEPASLVLLALGLGGIGFARKKLR